MKRPLKHYAIALYEAVQEPGANLQTVGRGFVQLLHRDGVLSKADSILAFFKKYWNEQKREIDCTVTTAHPLSSVQKKEIGDTIADMVKVTAVELHATIDEQLLGGIAIRYDDMIIDGSVRRQLAMMRERMVRS